MTVAELAERLLGIGMSAEPLTASLYGVPGYDHLLPDPSPAAEERLAGELDELAVHARELDPGGLSDTDRDTLDFVIDTARTQAPATRLPTAEFTVTSQHFAVLPAVLQLLPQVSLNTPERAAGYLARLEAMPGFVDAVVARHRDGLASGRLAVARLARDTVSYLDTLVADPDVGGLRMRTDAGEPGFGDQRDRLLDAALRPALRHYREVVDRELVPTARDDERPGLAHLPGGADMYGVLCRLHTGLARTPDELHRLGLSLAEELAEELCALGPGMLGAGELAQLVRRLRSDPDLRYATPEEMTTQAEAAVRRAEAAAPAFFGHLPDQPCRVLAVPDAEAPTAPPAYYFPPALDGSRPGTYFINTYRAQQRPRFTAESVAFHEAVPGHHFQLSIALHVGELPLARRLGGSTATIEGWGLYAERLADEMSLYSDDLARIGMVCNDLWRAARLVVDTGLHALGWSRDQAVRWMLEHTAISELEVNTEVDRYIACPGQALAYMVGRLELQDLRRQAARVRGPDFDLRAFHDLLLETGPLALPTLRAVVERWLAAG